MENKRHDTVITQTDFTDIKLFRRGKVRDVYDLGTYLLIVATDRISAFDVIMPDPIPGKGVILNEISVFWFSFVEDIIPNHLAESDASRFPENCKPYQKILARRSMLVRKTRPLPVECIVRGYLSGSGWNEYKKSGTVCSLTLPKGLKESDRLSEPIFTPSTKADAGHDVNIGYKEMEALIGAELSRRIRDISIEVYRKAAQYAIGRGIIIADTKMEFGLTEDQRLILIDELLTPDSSRFWPLEGYHPGGAQPSFDKQYLRDYLISIHWDNNTPPPHLPDFVIEQTRIKYQQAYDLLVTRKI